MSVKDPHSPTERAALDLLLSKLERSESTAVYQEMLAAAQAKIVPRLGA